MYGVWESRSSSLLDELYGKGGGSEASGGTSSSSIFSFVLFREWDIVSNASE
jgi:hypothetical protein